MLTGIGKDVVYAARTLAKSPGFTATAVLTIALGIGINTGIFSLLNGLAFRGLPAPGADELVAIHQTVQVDGPRITSGSPTYVSTSDFETYRDRSETLSGLVGHSQPWTAVLGGDVPREIYGTGVTCGYFEVLQQRPTIGAGLGPRHCDATSDGQVVVLSHSLWVGSFGADPAIVGRDVTLNGRPFNVVGVAPEGFEGIDFMKADFFAPITAQPVLHPGFFDLLHDDNVGWLALVGRRADGASIEQVRAELGVIAADIDRATPGRATRLDVTRATPFSAPDMRVIVLGISAVVMAGFVLVLVIACTNVANLLLARGDSRLRDIAIRLSLGATRARLVRQLMTESLLIAVLGGLLGTGLALVSFQSLFVLAQSALPSVFHVLRIDPTPDFRVLGFGFVLTIATGLVFGLAPALKLTRPDLRAAVDGDSHAAGLPASSRLQSVLVGVQVAVCMVLVAATALLLRGLYVAQTVDPRFEYDDLTVVSADLQALGYEGEAAAAFQDRLAELLGGVPGVGAVAEVLITPLELNNREFAPEPGLEFNVNTVSANYFSVVGIPIVRGRTFTAEETAGSVTTAVVVTESTARRLWPGQDPIGQTLNLGFDSDQRATVVGVARDAYTRNLSSSDQNYVYLPAIPRSRFELKLLLRSTLPPATIGRSVREAVAELDSRLAYTVAPLEANLDFWRRLSGVVAGLSSSLGALALVLACVGIYGVISFVVSRRVREIGIRRALGAGDGNVVSLLLRKSMRPVVIGAFAGLAACVAVSGVLSNLLFGVSPLDPIALTGAVSFVLALGAAAAIVPARRALRVDPMATLRYE